MVSYMREETVAFNGLKSRGIKVTYVMLRDSVVFHHLLNIVVAKKIESINEKHNLDFK